MKKKVLSYFFIAIFVVFISLRFVSSQTEEQINNAFRCLDTKVKSAPSITLQEAIFSALAKVPSNKVKSTITNEKATNEECWPKAGCKIKDTAQVLLAKKVLGEETAEIVEWLKSNVGVAKELTWYLQITIDNNAPASCTVDTGVSKAEIEIKEDMTLEGSAGSCFSISSSGYWLKINENCLDKTFKVSCSGDFDGFNTNLLYEKAAGGTIFISATTNRGSSGGFNGEGEKIKALCFKEGDNCNYEGSLWAASALNDAGENIDEFLPYLRAIASSNKKYFPDAFLLDILGSGRNSEHFNEIMQLRVEGHWDILNSPYSEFYDTSLAMLALGGADEDDVKDTLTYLFDVAKQTSDGCWNNNDIRDTALMIYAAGWQRTVTDDGDIVDVNDPDDSHLPPYDPDALVSCEVAGFFCVPDNLACVFDADGTSPGSNFVCANFGEYCCTKDIPSPLSCADKSGRICRQNERCDGIVVPSLDPGTCCQGICKEEEQYECINDDECALGENCFNYECIETGDDGDDGIETEGSNLTFWILVIGILIILILIMVVVMRRRRNRAFSKRISERLPPGMPPPNTFVRRGPPSFGAREATRPLLTPLGR